MWKQEAKRNLMLLIKAGIPYTIAGMVIVFLGLYLIQHFFAGSEYKTVLLFLWLALFWFIYQPMFRKRIKKVAEQTKKNSCQ